MVWDFVRETLSATRPVTYTDALDWICKALERFQLGHDGVVEQADASQLRSQRKMVYSTDPPYYDNVPYADLSDFFYVWLRKLS